MMRVQDNTKLEIKNVQKLRQMSGKYKEDRDKEIKYGNQEFKYKEQFTAFACTGEYDTPRDFDSRTHCIGCLFTDSEKWGQRIWGYLILRDGERYLTNRKGDVLYNVHSKLTISDVVNNVRQGSFTNWKQYSMKPEKSVRIERIVNCSSWALEINTIGLLKWMSNHPRTNISEILSIIQNEGYSLDMKTGRCIK